MKVSKVLVAGAGQMGGGIAQVAAEAGYSVVMTDISTELVEKGLAAVRSRLARAVEKGKMTVEVSREVTDRIEVATDFSAGRDADLFIEAAPESLELKRQVFASAGEHLRGDAILASNTSSISITKLAAEAGCPDRFVGIHFFNPVTAMALVEVVRGLMTPDEVVAVAEHFVESLGKKPVVVRDSPGFVVNRILLPMINEAAFTLQEGVAAAADIDVAMMAGANHPMGPLALADLIGLDTTLAALEVLHRDIGDPKYRPCPLLRQYVAAGRLGRKSGAGFYEY